MQNITVEIQRPKIELVIDGKKLAEFDYYDYSAVTEEAYKQKDLSDGEFSVFDFIRAWMIKNGLPDNVPDLILQDWMLACDKAMADHLKKMIGS